MAIKYCKGHYVTGNGGPLPITRYLQLPLICTRNGRYMTITAMAVTNNLILLFTC